MFIQLGMEYSRTFFTNWTGSRGVCILWGIQVIVMYYINITQDIYIIITFHLEFHFYICLCLKAITLVALRKSTKLNSTAMFQQFRKIW